MKSIFSSHPDLDDAEDVDDAVFVVNDDRARSLLADPRSKVVSELCTQNTIWLDNGDTRYYFFSLGPASS